MMKKKITGMILSIIMLSYSGAGYVLADEAEDTVTSDKIINEEQFENNEKEQNENSINDMSEKTEQTNENTEPQPSEIITETKIQQDDSPEQISNEISYDIPEPEYIDVQEIVVSEFKDSVFIGETQNMSATVFPASATDNTISYSSSDWSVAKVDRFGKVTAVGSGSCVITASCGGKYTSCSLKVKVKTEAISVKSKYIILKPGQQYELEAKAVPDNAPQNIKFKSQNAGVVTVDDNGVLTAVNNGSTSVIISNDDYTMSVNVIVNTEGRSESDNTDKTEINDSDISSSDQLAEMIRNSAEDTITVKSVNKISSEALRELYGTDKVLTVKCDGYDMIICGRDIINADHDFDTSLDFNTTEKGVMISQDKNIRLPGKISVKINSEGSDFRYMYLCSSDGKDYRRLNTLSGKNKFSISSSGEYLISEKKIESFRINLIWVFSAVGVILLLSVVYIFTKRKYWFW